MHCYVVQSRNVGRYTIFLNTDQVWFPGHLFCLRAIVVLPHGALDPVHVDSGHSDLLVLVTSPDHWQSQTELANCAMGHIAISWPAFLDTCQPVYMYTCCGEVLVDRRTGVEFWEAKGTHEVSCSIMYMYIQIIFESCSTTCTLINIKSESFHFTCFHFSCQHA